ncbi:DUF5994 family protein [Streptomyces mutabilis]|uniref:DUF5994 family protein n=1 Tax=Streptomyces mutabilis TaxID=67332 RepID=UPI003519E613
MGAVVFGGALVGRLLHEELLRITRVTVDPVHWPVIPPQGAVAGHVGKVGWFLAEQDSHELLLLSYRVGRWNLLVIPPSTPSASAAWLMAAGSDPQGTSTASRARGGGGRPADCREGRPCPRKRSGTPKAGTWSILPRVHGSPQPPLASRTRRRGCEDHGKPRHRDRALGGDRPGRARLSTCSTPSTVNASPPSTTARVEREGADVTA